MTHPASTWRFRILPPLKDQVLLLPLIGEGTQNAADEDVFALFPDLFERLQRENHGRQPAEMEILRPARQFFKAVGLDPTRTRPSSESLIRRVLQGKELFTVSRLVDLANVCSLESGLPVGLYDCSSLAGSEITLRLGRPGEEYESLGRGMLSLQGKPLLADAAGPFGMPVSDSARSGIRLDTRDFLFLFFAPADYDRKRLMEHGITAAARFTRHAGGRMEILGLI